MCCTRGPDSLFVQLSVLRCLRYSLVIDPANFRQLSCSNIDKCSVAVLGACVSGPSVCSFASMYGIYFDLL